MESERPKYHVSVDLGEGDETVVTVFELDDEGTGPSIHSIRGKAAVAIAAALEVRELVVEGADLLKDARSPAKLSNQKTAIWQRWVDRRNAFVKAARAVSRAYLAKTGPLS